MKKIIFSLLAFCILLGLMGGCSVTDMSETEKTPVQYGVIPQDEMPQEVKNLIEEKKKEEFQMTYQDNEYLYLIRGYGQQERGGYSIQVEEVSMGPAAIFFKTNLMGPSKEEKQSMEPSYPYIVVRIEYRDMPVQFQ